MSWGPAGFYSKDRKKPRKDVRQLRVCTSDVGSLKNTGSALRGKWCGSCGCRRWAARECGLGAAPGVGGRCARGGPGAACGRVSCVRCSFTHLCAFKLRTSWCRSCASHKASKQAPR